MLVFQMRGTGGRLHKRCLKREYGFAWSANDSEVKQ